MLTLQDDRNTKAKSKEIKETNQIMAYAKNLRRTMMIKIDASLRAKAMITHLLDHLQHTYVSHPLMSVASYACLRRFKTLHARTVDLRTQCMAWMDASSRRTCIADFAPSPPIMASTRLPTPEAAPSTPGTRRLRPPSHPCRPPASTSPPGTGAEATARRRLRPR